MTALLLNSSCSRECVDITVTNTSGRDIGPRCVEVPAGDILSRISTQHFYVVDGEGNEIPSQLTHDSMLVFMASVPAGGCGTYSILPSDSARTYEAVTGGNIYERRLDDLVWENDLVGFRAYGPGTRREGLRYYGQDLYLKHSTPGLILESLYGVESDPATWAKIDSLRAINSALADEFASTLNYNIDHGNGIDCYSVGETLGAGSAALIMGDTIAYPWCFEQARILDNGPLRFTVEMLYHHYSESDTLVPHFVEHRLVSLDAASHLNRSRVWFEGLESPANIVAGFPRHDDSPACMRPEKGIITYSDPTEGANNGKAFLGLYIPGGADSMEEKFGHILAVRNYVPGDTLDYYWGFAWDRSAINNHVNWLDYMEHFPVSYTVAVND